jgi:hypothetical protein
VLYDLKKPCDNCPFLKKGGVRLTQGRVQEIADAMLNWNGSTFACHKTTIDVEGDEGGERAVTGKSRHCAGALIFAEKNDNANQMMRIAERLGMYKPQELMADQAVVALVFDDVDEMLDVNAEAEGGRRKKRRR